MRGGTCITLKSNELAFIETLLSSLERIHNARRITARPRLMSISSRQLIARGSLGNSELFARGWLASAILLWHIQRQEWSAHLYRIAFS